jgi:hypothetical protein
MTSWIIIFLFSAALDCLGVLWARSVHLNKAVMGMLTTGSIASLSWISIWLVLKEDGSLIIPSVIGHMVGYLIGLKIPVIVSSEK